MTARASRNSADPPLANASGARRALEQLQREVLDGMGQIGVTRREGLTADLLASPVDGFRPRLKAVE